MCVSSEALTTAALFPSAPIKMSETRYDGFEKMGKKQNKEQVPPPAESENKKPASMKQSKKSHSSNTVSQTTYKNLEEAFKAVSKAHGSPSLHHLDVEKSGH